MTDSTLDLTPTTATRVTFFEDRARVTRRVTLDLNPNQGLLNLGGVTKLVDDASVTTKITNAQGASIEALSTQVKRRRLARTEDTPDAQRARQHQRDLQERLATLKDTWSRKQSERARLNTLEDTELAQFSTASPHDEFTSQIWAASFDAIDARYQEHTDELERLIDEIAQCTRDIERHQQSIDLTNDTSHEMQAYVVVQLEPSGSAPRAITIELSYFTPCALWRPIHRATLTADDKAYGVDQAGTLMVETSAAVWQRTGERWEDIECAFSTARPSQSAKPPKLMSDLLRARQKTNEERKSVDVEVREQEISVAKDVSQTAQGVPGMDDGGEPLTYHAPHRVTIESTGEAAFVEIAQAQVTCEINTVAYPERSELAWTTARATWRGELPLLAGPVTLVKEGELVGRAQMDFVAPQSVFTLGFGPDSAIRIRRTTRKKAVPKVMSKRVREEHTVHLYMSNLSDVPRRLRVVERVPVSEIEGLLVVEVIEGLGSEADEDGMITASVELYGGQVAKKTLRFVVDHAPHVRLHF